MKTFTVDATFTKRGEPVVMGHYVILARTKADAIVETQQRMAFAFGLTPSEECLVRVEFGKES